MPTHTPDVTPDVTVAVAAYNAMPYLTACVDSVIGQSIGTDRLELIAVNDGSTDDTGAVLDSYAREHPFMTVIHQAPSGGPSGPRNLGIERARGRYIFFLDSDDMLGTQALERMVDMADQHRSDVIVGRLAPIGARSVPSAMFRRNQPDADLYESAVYMSLRSQRMFRRSLLTRHHLRFPDVVMGDDLVFAAATYILAERISVLADYDCYYLRDRDDHDNLSRRVPAADRMLGYELAINTVADLVPPGPKRDFLMRRHFAVDVDRLFRAPAFPQFDEATRRDLTTRAQKLMAEHYTPEVAAAITPAYARLRLELVRRGWHAELAEAIAAWTPPHPDHLVEGGRVYARMPFFRDAARGLPDELYDVTDELNVSHRLDAMRLDRGALRIEGHARLAGLPAAAQAVRLVLRHRASGVEHAVAAIPAGSGDFHIDLDLSRLADGGPLANGVWDVHVEVETTGSKAGSRVRRRQRFGKRKAPDFTAPGGSTSESAHRDDARHVEPYFTSNGALSLRVRGARAKKNGARAHLTAPLRRLLKPLRRRLPR